MESMEIKPPAQVPSSLSRPSADAFAAGYEADRQDFLKSQQP
jgi:hypothetical protein